MGIEQLAQRTEARADPGALLATTMSVNALFSGGCGLVLVVGAPALSGGLGVPARLLAGLGVGLVVFAGLLLWILAEPSRLAAGGRAALASDLAWIAAAVLLLAGFPSVLTPAGNTALAVVTGVVAVLAVAQALGLLRMRDRHASGTSRIRVQAQRVITAPPERVWAAIADVADYARFTSNIAATEVVTGSGDGMVRACTDSHGARWLETCTLWEQGRRYRMTVDVDTYPLYYRVLLHELMQTWAVEPIPDGARVTLTFDAAVKLGVIGRVVGRMLSQQLSIEDILDAYDREICRP